MKTALTFLLLIAALVSHAQATFIPVLSIKSVTGHTDVSVTTSARSQGAEMGWASETALPMVHYRNVAKFPLRITNPTNGVAWIGPTVDEHPEWFVTSSIFPGLVMFKDFVRITVMNELDEIIREETITVPIQNLIVNGRVEIRPGTDYQVMADLALFDKTGMPNNRVERINTEPPRFLFIEIDPFHRVPGLNCNNLTVARFYSYQVRHSESVDIP